MLTEDKSLPWMATITRFSILPLANIAGVRGKKYNSYLPSGGLWHYFMKENGGVEGGGESQKESHVLETVTGKITFNVSKLCALTLF